MMKRRRMELKSSRRSVSYYSDLQGREGPLGRTPRDYFSLQYPRMLIEDISLGIMPIGARSKNASFKVSLTPDDKRIEKLIETGIRSEDSTRGFPAAVCDFFRECAQTMMGYGQAIFEIVTFSNPETQAIESFQLAFIQPRTLFNRWGKACQHLPKAVAEERNLPEHVYLDSERILRFKFPKSIQHLSPGYMESLSLLSGKLFPDFAMQDITEKRAVPYDSTDYLRWRRRALADATKEIGWNSRSLFEEDALEYYTIHRQLIFERFKIELRNSILDTLNHGIKCLGDLMGFKAEIRIEGLPTVDDVENAQSNLSNGRKAFKELLAPFLG
jgi:hypothetical protein